MYIEDIKIADIKKIPILNNFNDVELTSLLEVASIDAYKPGQFIFREGDTGSCILMIIFGGARICKNSPDGKMYEIAQINENDFFGEMSFLDVENRIRSANAVASGETFILSFSEESFRVFVTRNPHPAFRFLRNIALELQKRLKQSNAKLVKNYDDLLRTHNAIVDSRNFLSSIITCASDVIIILDAAERVSLFNSGAEQNLKISASLVIGKTIEYIFMDGQYRPFINELYAGRNIYNRDIYLRTADGGTILTSFSAFATIGVRDNRQFLENIAIIAKKK
ncbi:MAG TPA: cyclic nucleotide-binding domain-containing protein [Candidatus Wallbacteria bacterium]|nr:cyclic nucleotide-binding domain-containing protein [Candidatus Wallbacteria bacterium]